MNKRPLMLSATFVRNVSVPGRYGDGRGGLGLGRYPVVTLAMARERALQNARAIARGCDPRRAAKSVPTFAQALETVISIHAPTWKDRAGSERQWRASLATNALPHIGAKAVDAVSTVDIMAVLLPIWATRRVTASRVRQRIGAVMKVGHRAGPARRQPRRRGDRRRATRSTCSARQPFLPVFGAPMPIARLPRRSTGPVRRRAALNAPRGLFRLRGDPRPRHGFCEPFEYRALYPRHHRVTTKVLLVSSP